mmetsp:Transcript_42855/g.48348  ORF Transcript_42855/g.48348 Transcript_42855/m.48348 type:complete len:93 (-) Transcript_42855:636-914(-)
MVIPFWWGYYQSKYSTTIRKAGMVDTCAAQFEVVPPPLHRSVLLMWNTLPPEMETYFQHTDFGDDTLDMEERISWTIFYYLEKTPSLSLHEL